MKENITPKIVAREHESKNYMGVWEIEYQWERSKEAILTEHLGYVDAMSHIFTPPNLVNEVNARIRKGTQVDAVARAFLGLAQHSVSNEFYFYFIAAIKRH